jgi:large subunit ribosomal protein L1
MGKTKKTTIGVTEITEIEEKDNKKKSLSVEDKKKKKTKESKKSIVESITVNRKNKAKGKKFLKAKSKINKDKLYSIEDAVKLLKEISYEKFDASVEIHINLNDKSVKGEVTLPHGTGKEIKVAIFGKEVIKELEAKTINFDILLAKTSDMKDIVKYARFLGPKGLMPSPKKGTLVEDVEKAKKKLQSGTIHYKSESKFPILHQVVGKVSFTTKQLKENIDALIKAINKKYINEVYITGSMTPSIKVLLETK